MLHNNKVFFGTDGIRGKVGHYPITADFFLKLGWAAGSVFSALKKGNTRVVIGKDTRISGYMLESALEAGFLSAGIDVGLLGPMPTPAVAYLTLTYRATAGVVISASHNCFLDNGVKFFSEKGLKLDGKVQTDIEKKLKESFINKDSDNIGKAYRHEQPRGRYIEFCKSTFDRSISLSELNIIIDCANGATYHIAKNVFLELGANVTIINDNPNGSNINFNCGVFHVDNLKQRVINEGFDLGIVFDGDGDRVIMVDAAGELVDGDELLFIIAKYLKNQNKLQNNIVVGTKMTNMGVRYAFNNLGINFIEADVGDRFVMQEIIKNNAILGGEGSGHIICFNKTTSGDGIISALQVLEVIVKSGKSLSELKLDIQKYHQKLVNIAVKNNIDDVLQNKKLKKIQFEVEKKLSTNGRLLIRKSGTEPIIRVMVESNDLNLVKKSIIKLKDTINLII